MGQVLYRKYRSRSLDELVGQDHITDGLSRAIKAGNISHAYLFTGPRGTGKTSIARILAHMLNGFEFDDPCSHLDIIEIDAASNRRIDEIRDLREKVNIAPTTGKYKVYIIDEVHMLTREAFNALLKTLEEPPAHAIFMLATTELHKLPETIVSRTQRYSLKPIEKKVIVSHLKNIAKQESITIDNEALELIADHAEGGFRDAISLLDQIRHGADSITAETVADSLGMPPKKLVEELWQEFSTASADTSRSLQALLELGYHAPRIASELLHFALRDRNVLVAEQLLDVESSHNPDMKLRLIIIAGTATDDDKKPEATKPAVKKILSTEPAVAIKLQEKEPEEKVVATKPQEEVKSTETAIADNEPWSKVLESIKEAGHAVYGPLRLAEAEITNGILKLRLRFPFHIKRVAETQNIKLIADTYEKITGKSIKIDVGRIEQKNSSEETKAPVNIRDQKPSLTPVQSKSDEELMTDPLSIVKNVFGNAEVL